MIGLGPVLGEYPKPTVHKLSEVQLRLQVAVLRLLQQLGQVYSVMKIDSIKSLIPFLNFGEVEAIIVDAVKSEFIQVPPFQAGCPALP